MTLPLGVPCFRTSYATLQSVLRHRCGIAVMIGNKPFTAHEVVSTQTHGVGFLAVGAFALHLLLKEAANCPLGYPKADALLQSRNSVFQW